MVIKRSESVIVALLYIIEHINTLRQQVPKIFKTIGLPNLNIPDLYHNETIKFWLLILKTLLSVSLNKRHPVTK